MTKPPGVTAAFIVLCGAQRPDDTTEEAYLHVPRRHGARCNPGTISHQNAKSLK
jgi:hypothetical protein